MTAEIAVVALIPGFLGGVITFALMRHQRWSGPSAFLAGVAASLLIGTILSIAAQQAGIQ